MSKHHHKHHRDATILLEHEPHPRWTCVVHTGTAGGEHVAFVELAHEDAVHEAHGRAPTGGGVEAVAETLAVARALSGLSHQLLLEASHDIHAANGALGALGAAPDITA